ncbi:MAG: hypothetical protein HY821_02195 [Acidobacteria bacterium]|nr:hypothetical protein [Acidobacteriota bacterium]
MSVTCKATALFAFLAVPGVLWSTVICFYGADLDQDKAKDTAKNLVNAAVAGGAKGSVGTDIAGGDIFNSMKTAAGTCFNASTGKFDCGTGVLLVYISSHGDKTADGKDTVIGNLTKGPHTTLSALTKSIAGTIPECCTVIFAIDACFADAWYNNSIPDVGGNPNPNNPFKDLNYLVAVPAGEGRCFGTPVGSALSKAFGAERSISQLSDFLGSQQGVRTTWSADDQHNYTFKLTPEPATLWLTLIGFILVFRPLRQRYAWLSPFRLRIGGLGRRC